MRAKFSQSFKMQAVKKALGRSEGTSLREVSNSLGIGVSTLTNWVVRSRNQELEPVTDNNIVSLNGMSKEKRPQDWSTEERLKIVIRCGSLDQEAINKLCREKGIFPHHVTKWQQDFEKGSSVESQITGPSEMKNMKLEIKLLKQELNRKNRALAETAALLVLQKKAQAIWGNDEDNSL